MRIEERQAQIDAFLGRYFPEKDSSVPQESAVQPVNLDDDALLQKAFDARNGDAFGRLWSGDWGDYPSHSEADLALCSHLAFWTGRDAERANRLFRASGLFRPKWDEKHGKETYGEMTIQRAIEVTTETYQDSRTPPVSGVSKATPAPPEKMAPEAFYGIAGEVAHAIDPHTEASGPGILISFLVAAGNEIGKGPHAVAEADRHGTNINTALVGDTSKGRKGSAWGHIMELFSRVDPTWTQSRIQGGMTSGEGLLWAVRDPIERSEPVKDKGKATGEHQTVVVDPGVDDKRLLAIEPEFASVLKVMLRESNILSTQIRQAWDTGNLRTMTKNNPATATGAHVSIQGHITKNELLRYLTDTEAGNGFANRFLWVCTRRSKVLPEGGGEPNYQHLAPKLHDALERARRVGKLERDAEAKEAWAEVYPELSEGQPGLFGAVTARAEAQVLRLSVLYAALDGAAAIRLSHLKAALAVWEYCEDSARWIFGDATGDPIADRILEALSHGELTRTTIYSGLFGRNVSAGRIAQALALLLTHGRARHESRDPEGKGRPTEIWARI